MTVEPRRNAQAAACGVDGPVSPHLKALRAHASMLGRYPGARVMIINASSSALRPWTQVGTEIRCLHCTGPPPVRIVRPAAVRLAPNPAAAR